MIKTKQKYGSDGQTAKILAVYPSGLFLISQFLSIDGAYKIIYDNIIHYYSAGVTS